MLYLVGQQRHIVRGGRGLKDYLGEETEAQKGRQLAHSHQFGLRVQCFSHIYTTPPITNGNGEEWI